MGELTGKLLISNASLFDPNFRKTVVLVGHHDDEGAVGVVLNRVLEVAVDEAVPPLSVLVPPGEPLFVGGPVQPEAAVVVAEFEDPSRAGVIAFDHVGFLPEEADHDDLTGMRRARVFAGYAGWGPGQLEAELEEDAWLVAPATADDVFHDDPERLWDDVVRRLDVRHQLLRTLPVDPSLN
ncbi:MAG TPA: YqgE/AlgH family protein [Actinomycetota bacterium]